LLCFSALAGCGGEGLRGVPGSPPDAPGSGSVNTTDKQAAEADDEQAAQTAKPAGEQPSKTQSEESEMGSIQATITMADGGVIVLELYPDIAPQSVRNFVYLARQGIYDGLKFHRIISGFMIQGGDPDGNGTGGPGYSIFGEFGQNGWKNNLRHKRGVISMARSNAPDSAGSQFFIVHEDADFLDGSYAAFGKVTSGMDVVDKLANTPVTDDNGTVAEKVKPVIESITIDSDIELPEPDKLEK